MIEFFKRLIKRKDSAASIPQTSAMETQPTVLPELKPPEPEITLTPLEQFKREITSETGKYIELAPAPNGEPRHLLVLEAPAHERGIHSRIFIFILQNHQPVAHYDWKLRTEGGLYADGNSYQLDEIQRPPQEHQALIEHAQTIFQSTDAVEVLTTHRQQKLGSLLIAASVLVLKAHHVQPATLGIISPLAQKLWDAFEYKHHLMNQTGGRLELYPESGRWIDITKLVRNPKIDDALEVFRPKA